MLIGIRVIFDCTGLLCLQVEHPVTEGISSVNIPAAQLMIGMGIPLWAMPSMRQLYGLEAGSEGPFGERSSLPSWC